MCVFSLLRNHSTLNARPKRIYLASGFLCFNVFNWGRTMRKLRTLKSACVHEQKRAQAFDLIACFANYRTESANNVSGKKTNERLSERIDQFKCKNTFCVKRWCASFYSLSHSFTTYFFYSSCGDGRSYYGYRLGSRDKTDQYAHIKNMETVKKFKWCKWIFLDSTNSMCSNSIMILNIIWGSIFRVIRIRFWFGSKTKLIYDR